MPTTSQTTETRRAFLLGLILFVVTCALYWPATTHGFMALDDALYVSGNPQVMNGLSFAGLKWAFTSAYASNWHPLTWLSHMLDWSLFGDYAGGHHLTNLLLHAANTLLLFLALQRLTLSPWPSFVVAALFGWHPLHVESVAWIAERKDVLSTFFWMLTLLAYANYAEKSKVQSPRSKVYYVLTLLCFALGLLSKPMVVTLPFVLLLLDFWPLRRIADFGFRISDWEPADAGTPYKSTIRNPQSAIIEKIPFFVLSLAACAATIIAQHAGGAIKTTAEVPYGLRILNALTAYVSYAGKAFWPAHLSIYYLLPDRVPLAPATCAAVAMIAVTAFTFLWRARWPWMLVGWLWFVGTLVPVIGLVQVGNQAMADRYTYVPLIGLFIAVVWSLERAFATLEGRNGRVFAGAIAAGVLFICLALTHIQLGYWRDNVTLFQHAVEATPDNYFAEYEFGTALADAGKLDAAIAHHTISLKLNPWFEPSQYHLGLEYAANGRLDDAAANFIAALKRDPTSEELHNNLGVVFARQNKLDAAIEQFQQAIQFSPANASPYLNCALAQERLGHADGAFKNFTKARELEPDSPVIMMRLACFLATCPDAQWRNPSDALKLADAADKKTGHQDPQFLATLATASAATGDYTNAAAVAEQALAKAREQHLDVWAKKFEGALAAFRTHQMPPADWLQPQP